MAVSAWQGGQLHANDIVWLSKFMTVDQIPTQPFLTQLQTLTLFKRSPYSKPSNRRLNMNTHTMIIRSMAVPLLIIQMSSHVRASIIALTTPR